VSARLSCVWCLFLRVYVCTCTRHHKHAQNHTQTRHITHGHHPTHTHTARHQNTTTPTPPTILSPQTLHTLDTSESMFVRISPHTSLLLSPSHVHPPPHTHSPLFCHPLLKLHPTHKTKTHHTLSRALSRLFACSRASSPLFCVSAPLSLCLVLLVLPVPHHHLLQIPRANQDSFSRCFLRALGLPLHASLFSSCSFVVLLPFPVRGDDAATCPARSAPSLLRTPLSSSLPSLQHSYPPYLLASILYLVYLSVKRLSVSSFASRLLLRVTPFVCCCCVCPLTSQPPPAHPRTPTKHVVFCRKSRGSLTALFFESKRSISATRRGAEIPSPGALGTRAGRTLFLPSVQVGRGV
jgi:hypothetical protein